MLAWLRKLRTVWDADEYERGYKDTAYLLLNGTCTPIDIILSPSGEPSAYDRGRIAATLRFMELRLKS